MNTELNLTQMTRKEKAYAWLRANGMTFTSIAQALGVSARGVSLMFTRDSIPTKRHAQLVSEGVPAELLPPALDISPGPKPKRAEFCEA